MTIECQILHWRQSVQMSTLLHRVMDVNVAELVHWTGVPIRNGALDGKPGMLNVQWNNKDARYDQCIDDSISKS